MKFIWKLIHGKERVARARAFGAILQDSTCNLGGYGHNTNINGEPIRERVTRVTIDRRHPLEKRYS